LEVHLFGRRLERHPLNGRCPGDAGSFGSFGLSQRLGSEEWIAIQISVINTFIVVVCQHHAATDSIAGPQTVNGRGTNCTDSGDKRIKLYGNSARAGVIWRVRDTQGPS
jgi:hypothetical protein